METLSAADAARLLHLNVKRIQTLARLGRLPAVRIGRKWLFRRDQLEALLGAPAPVGRRPGGKPSGREARARPGELSARNQLRCRVVGVHRDGLMAEVRLTIGGQELVSVITRSSADRLGLKVGSQVYAVIKSTEVMIGR